MYTSAKYEVITINHVTMGAINIHSFPLILATFLLTWGLYRLEISAPNAVNVFNLGWILSTLYLYQLEKSVPTQVVQVGPT